MWSAAAGADEYRIERSLDGVSFTAVGTTASTSFLDSGLTAATTYRYRVVAVSDAGETASSVLTATTDAEEPTGPVDGIPEWSATAAYTRGDLVQHLGVVYRAVQSHRGWGDETWITALSLWEPTTAPAAGHAH
ncbi:hypothetical protein LBN7_001911 [Microbacterium sp. LBN7]